jgi:superfamily II DNA or RNA helicase
MSKSKPSSRRRPKPEEPKVSRQHKPEGMTLEEWQTLLRRQYGRSLGYKVRNLGDHPAFSDFLVSNPTSGSSYRVTVRGTGPGDNTCSCPDFATNTLGTCKHVEFVLARLERGRGARAELKAGYRPATGEVFLRYGARREVCFAPPVEASPDYSKLAARYFDSAGRLRPAAVTKFDTFLESAREFDPDLKVGSDVFTYLAEVRDAETRVARVAEAFPKGTRSAAFKDLLAVPLYDYQREGVLFAARAGRCLIGDEMGLGKTAQALGAAEAMARVFGVERVLIVCPTSLKHQWKGEVARFTARPVRVIEGDRTSRAAAFADPAPFFKITNYDTVHTDLAAIAGWAPELVILDEAQRIKNWSTRVARSVKAIHSPYAVVLTGTPLENRLEELISIVQFVDPHRLGPTFRLLHDHQVLDPVGKVVGYRDLDKLGQTLAPILIRRLKDQVLDQLPERIESAVFVPMTPLQRDLHTESQEEVARIVAKWRRLRFLTEADKQRLMASLQKMRMVCDSSYLLDAQTDQGLKVGEIMTVLGELLERQGAKAVVFSQWVRMHELLVKAAKRRKWEHVRFHGGLSGRERGKLVELFRDDPKCRLFFSTDAGGVGLNLQFASAVVNVDLPWNPAVLEQRIGRVHRLGQREPVRVVNFVAKGSIEEGMLSVLQFKRSLFTGILDGGPADVELGGSRLTKFIEAVEATTAVIPQPTVGEGAEAEEATREFADKPAPGEKRDAADAAPSADPWSALLQAGAAVLQRLMAAPSGSGSGSGSGSSAGLVRKDEKTGESYLRLPVPSEAAVADLVAALGRFLDGTRK